MFLLLENEMPRNEKASGRELLLVWGVAWGISLLGWWAVWWILS